MDVKSSAMSSSLSLSEQARLGGLACRVSSRIYSLSEVLKDVGKGGAVGVAEALRTAHSIDDLVRRLRGVVRRRLQSLA